MDGLVNYYNTTIVDENDALVQVFNHGSSIAHADFLSDDKVFAISHDEIFSIYDTKDDMPSVEQDSTHTFGDLRPQLHCEYVVDLANPRSSKPVIGAGSHRFTIPVRFSHFKAYHGLAIAIWRSSRYNVNQNGHWTDPIPSGSPALTVKILFGHCV